MEKLSLPLQQLKTLPIDPPWALGVDNRFLTMKDGRLRWSGPGTHSATCFHQR